MTVTRSYLLKMPCVDCGRPIIGLTPRRLRCEDCAKKKKYEQCREWLQKKVVYEEFIQ